MSRFDRPVYAPPPLRASRGVRLDIEDTPRRQPILLILSGVIVTAFAAIVWNVYGGFSAGPPRIAPADASYKSAPSAAMLESESAVAESLYDTLEGRDEDEAVRLRPADEAPLTDDFAAADAAATAEPVFARDGAYVAQIAALRTQDSVQPLWSRLSARDPALFADASLDVQHADLGQQGIYWRVRAGAFADRANAEAFCNRVRALGQDCIAVRR